MLPTALTDALTAYERRRGLRDLLRGVGEAVAVQGTALLTVATMDALFHPGVGVRTGATVVAWGMGTGWLLWRGLLPWWRRQSALASAQAIERAAGTLHDRLSSAVCLSAAVPAGTSAWMAARTVAIAATEAAHLDLKQLINRAPLVRAARCAGATLAVLAAVAAVPAGRGYLMRALMPHADLARPSAYHFTLTPGNATVPRGSRFAVSAQIEPVPDDAILAVTWDDGLVERLAMSSRNGHFAVEVPAAARPFRYQVEVDGGASIEAHVAIVDPPVLSGITMVVTPPAYTGLPAKRVPAGDINVTAGTRIAFEAAFTGAPVEAARLVREGFADVPFALASPEAGTADLLPESTQTWGVRLVATGGLIAEPGTRWLITVNPDAAPLLNLSLVGRAAGLAALDETVAVEVDATDDFGFRNLELVISDASGDLERRTIPANSQRSVLRAEPLELGQLHLTEGQTLSLHLEAVDVGGNRTVGQNVEVVLAGGVAARAAALAARLRPELSALDARIEELHAADTSWKQLQRGFRREDPSARSGEAVVLGERLNALVSAVQTSATKIAAGAKAIDAPGAPRVLAFSEELGGWAKMQDDLLACPPAVTSGDSGALVQGRDLTQSAQTTLAALRQTLALHVARLEAEALHGRCTAAVARASRATPVLRGLQAWLNPGTQPGLQMIVHEGIDPNQGNIVRDTIAQPTWSAIAACGRGELVSVRFVGELHIPTEGVWQLQAVADDGVRVQVDGQPMLPAEAWRDQAPTPWQGERQFTAGWHPVVIEFYQGGGGAALTINLAPAGQPLVAVPSGSWRSGSGTSTERTLAAMVAASPALAVAARDSLARSLTTAAEVPATLERWAADTGRQPLKDLAHAGKADSQHVAAAAALADKLDAADHENLAQRVKSLAEIAEAARDHLAAEADSDQQLPGALAALRALTEAIREHGDTLRKNTGQQPAADRAATIRREVAAIQSAHAILESELAAEREKLHARAHDPAASQVERARALAARDALADQVAKAAAALAKAVAQPNEDSSSAGGEIAAAACSLDQALAHAEAKVAAVEAERTATMARVTEAHAEAAFAAEQAGDTATAKIERQAAAQSADALGDRLRDAGRHAEASKVDNAITDSFERHDAQPLSDVAQQLTPKDAKPDLDQLAAKALDRAAKDPQIAHEEAAAAADALALASVKAATDNDEPRAATFGKLAEEAGQEARKDQPESAKLTELAQRTREAASGKNDATAKVEPAVAAAAALARQAEQAAAHQEQRAGAAAALAKAAAAKPTAAAQARASAAERLATANRLDALAAKESKLAADEAAARKAFAEAEAENAAAFAALAETSKNMPGQSAQAAAPLQAAAAAAKARAEQAAQPGPDSSALAQAARSAADHTARDAATPHAQAAAASEDAAQRKAASDTGMAVVDAAAKQRAAADQLDRALDRRAANRAELAKASAKAAQLAGLTPSAEALEAAADAASKSDSASQAESAASQMASDPTSSPASAAEAAANERAGATAAQEEAMAARNGEAAAVAPAAAGLLAGRRSADAAADAMAARDPAMADALREQVASAHQKLMAATAGMPAQASAAAASLRQAPAAPAAGAAPAAAAPNSQAAFASAADRLGAAAADAAMANLPGPTPPSASATAASKPGSGKPGSGKPGQPGQPGQPGMPGAPDQQPGPSSSSAQAATGAGAATGHLATEANEGSDQAAWARSRGDLRGDVAASGADRFAEEDQEAIRAYFSTLAEER